MTKNILCVFSLHSVELPSLAIQKDAGDAATSPLPARVCHTSHLDCVNDC